MQTRGFPTTLSAILSVLAVMLIPLSFFSNSALGLEVDDLNGHWISTCIPGEVFGQTRTDEYIIEGSNTKQRTTYYGDASCTKPIIRADWTIRMNVGAGEVRPGVRALDITYERAEVTALNTVGTNILEAWGYCGLSEWPTNISREVTDNAGRARCVAPLPLSNYTIYSVIDGKLFIGFGFNNNVDRRPTELNVDNPFTRVP